MTDIVADQKVEPLNSQGEWMLKIKSLRMTLEVTVSLEWRVNDRRIV